MRLASSGGRPATAAALEGRQRTIDEDRQVTRKELSAIARDAMKGLKLSPSERHLLGELVGCWGEVMLKDRILIYPSNEYLVERTGLAERSVRYGIRRLVDRGLITPKDSANGKRFAIKSRGGVIVDVFGFDLTPLYARRAEFVDQIYAIRADNERRSRIFDEITICRRAVEETLNALARLSENAVTFLQRFEQLRDRTPRRSHRLAIATITPVLESWRRLRSEIEEFFYRTASGGNSCQHIESKPTQSNFSEWSKKPSEDGVRGEYPATPTSALPVELVVEACPSLLQYTERPKTEVDLVAAGRFLRSSLGAHASVWEEAVDALGPINAAVAVCYVLEIYENKSGQIRNPGGYLRAVVRMLKDGRMSLRTELLSLIRKRKM